MKPYIFFWYFALLILLSNVGRASGNSNISGYNPLKIKFSVLDFLNYSSIKDTGKIINFEEDFLDNGFPKAVFTISATSTNVTCYGLCDGTITVSENTGTPIYPVMIRLYRPAELGPPATVDYYNIASLPYTITGLCGAVAAYSVRVRDNNGAGNWSTNTVNKNINAPGEMIILEDSVRDVTCSGKCDGYLEIIYIDNATYPVDYLWSNGETTAAIDTLCPGTYSVTVTDANNCTKAFDDYYTITEPPVLSVTYDSTNVTCLGANNGTITINVSGGTLPYTYTWNDIGGPGAVSSRTNLPPATYCVTVADANGCSWNRCIQITEPATGLVVTIPIASNPSCAGLSDGSLTARASGGTAPYSYVWNVGIFIPDSIATGLAAGCYTVTASDVYGCSANTSRCITDPPAVTGSATPNAQTICSGQSTSITLSSTFPSPTFSWTVVQNGVTGASDGSGSSIVQTLTYIGPPGTVVYTVTPTSGGCDGTPFNVIVTVNPDNTITLTSAAGTDNQTVCINSAITNITYSTTGATGATITGLPAGVTGSWAANVVTITGTPTASGTFNYTITLTGGCGNVTTTGTITVNPANTITLTSAAGTDNQTVCINSAITNITYSTTGATGATVTGLPAGVTGSWAANVVTITGTPTASGTFNYTITLTGGCGNITKTGAITVILVNTITLTSAAGTDNQTVCINSAITNITYSTTGATGATITGLPAGVTGSWAANVVTITGTPTASGTFNYTITLTGGCGNVTTTGTITVNTNPVATASNNGPVCVGDLLSLTGGPNGMTSYAWTGPNIFVNNTQSPTVSAYATSAMTGVYTLVVTGGTGCTGTTTTTVTVNTKPTATAGNNSPVCIGSTLNLTSSAVPNGLYTYSWSGPNSFVSGSQNPSILNVTAAAAGTYTVIITRNSTGCKDTATTIVTLPPQLIAQISDSIMSCGSFQNQSAGTTFLPDGNGMEFTSSITHTVFAPTTTIQDANDIMVTLNMEHSYLGDIRMWITCPSGQSVYLKGVQQYQPGFEVFLGIPNENDDEINPLNPATNPPGTGWDYNFSSTAAYGSMLQESINHQGQPAWHTLPQGQYKPEQSFNGLIGCPMNGTWTIHVIDDWQIDNGYIFLWRLDILDTSLIPAFYCDGSAMLTISGGTPPYSIHWNSGPSNDTITDLCAGQYCVTVTDANTCTATDCVTITDDMYTINTSTTNPGCNGGSNGTITVTITDGYSPYTITLTGPSTDTTVTTPDTSYTFTGLLTGTYYISVLDLNLCPKQDTLILTNPNAINITSITNSPQIKCHNDTTSITIVANGGTGQLTYHLSPVDSNYTGIFHGMHAGTYNITVHDVPGCYDDSTYTIAEPDTLIINSQSFTNDSCYGECDGTITISASGGTGQLTYWANLSSNITGLFTLLCPNTYTISVKDANLCSATGTPVIISQPSAFTITEAHTNETPCFNSDNGTLTLTATGGTGQITYTITGPVSNTTGLFTGLAEACYTPTITDANHCDTTLSPVCITAPPTITATAVSTNLIKCHDECLAGITITASGGTGQLSYSINGGVSYPSTTGIFNNLCPGTYTLKVKDANGCTVDCVPAAITFINPPELLINTITITPFACSVDTTTITATASGGTGTLYYYINYGPPPLMGPDLDGIFHGVQTGIDTLTVEDFNNCRVDSVFTIAPPTGIHVDTAKTNVLCHGLCTGSATLTVTGGTPGYHYSWSNNGTLDSPTQNNLCAGVYTITVSDHNIPPCSTLVSITITEPDTIILTMDTTSSHCGQSDGSATVTATGGVGGWTYNWAPIVGSSNTLAAIPFGMYFVTVTDGNACQKIDTAVINDIGAPVVTFSNIVNNPCYGQCVGSANAVITQGTPPYDPPVWSGPLGYTFTGNPATNMCAGDYWVTVTDINGCSTMADTAITEGALITLQSFDSTNVTCFGLSDGTISAVATGGTGSLHYDIGGGTQISGNFSNLACGNFTLTVTDDSSCSITRPFTIICPSDITINTQTSTNITCHGFNDGTITVSATGGTGTLYYHFLLDSNITGIFSLLGPGGPYTITVIDSMLCFEISNPFTITEPDTLSYTTTDIQPDCGTPNGSITIHMSGGALGYSFLWFDGSADSTISNLSAGTYTCVVTDANGCSITVYDTLINPGAGTISFEPLHGISCFGDTTASFVIHITGGNPPYTVDWGTLPAHHIHGDTLVYLGPGTYTVSVTDLLSCINIKDTTITGPDSIYIQSATPGNLSCYHSGNGTITAVASGGTGTITYCINTIPLPTCNTTGNFTGLAAGNNYTLTVTDDSLCSNTRSPIVITEPDTLILLTNSFDAHCNQADGKITVMATGGTPAYVFNPGSILTGLTPNIYTVTVTDSHGCTATATDTVQNISPGTVAFVNQANNLCFGDTLGSVTAWLTNAPAPHTYAWTISPDTIIFSTDSAIINLSCGLYTVMATDTNGCIKYSSVEITCPPQIILTIQDTMVTCNGQTNGSITITASGGTPGFTYIVGADTNQTGYFPGLGANIYNITVTDTNGCSVITSDTITQPNPLFLNADITYPTCGDTNGVIALNPAGGTLGYTYHWLPGDSTTISISNLYAGNYSVTLTDTNGCTKDSVVFLSNQNGPLIAFNPVTNLTCFGVCEGTATADVTGDNPPFHYAWSNGDTTATADSLCADTTYYITVTDNLGCTSYNSLSLTQPDSISITTITTPILCYGDLGAISVTANGGTNTFSYSINPPGTSYTTDNIFTGLPANTYTITARDSNHCSNTTSPVVLFQPDSMTLTTVFNNIVCHSDGNASITVTASGGTPSYNYILNGILPPDTIGSYTNLLEGSYFIEVTDSFGCQKTAGPFDVSDPPLLLVSTSGQDPHCLTPDGCAYAAASGGVPPYSYYWQPGGPANDTLCGILAGNYTVDVTDSRGCIKSATESLSDQGTCNIVFSGVTPVLCYNSTTGTACVAYEVGCTSTPQSYLWDNGETTSCATQLPGGINGVTITDALGCQSDTTVNIIAPDSFNVHFTVTDILCHGANTGTISFLVTGGTAPYQFSITGVFGTFYSSSVFTSLAAGTYQLAVRDTHLCTKDIGTVTLTEPSAITLSAPVVTDVACHGGNNGAISITAGNGTPPYQYQISPPFPVPQWTGVFTSLTAGTYTITVEDQNGCTESSAPIIVTEPDSIIVTVTVTDATCGACDGSAIVSATGGTPGYTYLWDISAGGGNDTIAVNLCAGTYPVTVTDSHFCSAIGFAFISSMPNATLTFTETNVTCPGGNDGSVCASITGGVSPYTYLWSNDSTDNCITQLPAGIYFITITDSMGCIKVGSDTITDPYPITLALVDSSDVSCYGGSNGVIHVSASGGTPGYLYTINLTSNNTGDFTGLAAGDHIITVEDTNHCVQSFPAITLGQPLTPLHVITTVDSSACGDSTGVAYAWVSGGSPNYTYLWTPGNQTNYYAWGLAFGLYTVVVTDTNGCTESAQATISDSGPGAVSFTQVQNAGCFGSCDGSATAVLTGATAVSYEWPTLPPYPFVGQTATGLCAGAYPVNVLTSDGCTKSNSVNITQPDSIYLTSLTITNVSCYGSNNGTISATADGGTPYYVHYYQFSIDSITFFANNGQFTGLAPDTMSLWIRDSLGCTRKVTPIIITQPTQIQINYSVIEPDCGMSDGSIFVSPTGGTPFSYGYTYLWDTPPLYDNDTLQNIPSGLYSITVTDSLLCSVDTIIALSDSFPGVLTINPVVNNNCFGECTAWANATVTGATEPVTITWGNGDTGMFADSLCDDVTIHIVDALGCQLNDIVSIYTPTIIQSSNIQTNNLCYNDSNGSFTLTATGGTPGILQGYQYILTGDTNSTGLFDTLASGIYIVTIKDSLGCTQMDTVTITSPPAISTSITSTNTNCNLIPGIGFATVTATGGTPGYDYIWSNIPPDHAATADSLTAGVYFVTVTDINGCIKTDTAFITDNDAGVINFDPVKNVTCYGDSTGWATANITGGIPPYHVAGWDNGDITYTADTLIAGVHWVEIHDTTGCISIDTIIITQPQIIHIEDTLITDATCYQSSDGVINLLVEGGYPSYEYSTDGGSTWGTSSSFTGLAAGDHIIIVRDDSSCVQQLPPISVGQPDDIVLTSTIDSSSCTLSDGSATVTAIGGTSPYYYLWCDSADNQVTPIAINLHAGAYGVTVTDFNGCKDSLQVLLSDEGSPSITFNPVVNNLCFGDALGYITAEASGGLPYSYGYDYLWSNVPPDITTTADNLSAGNYFVSVTDSLGCISLKDTTITQPDSIQVTYSDTAANCHGTHDGSLVFIASGGTPPYLYSIDTLPPSSSGTFTGLGSGAYLITIEDTNGCQKIFDSIMISEPDSIIITLAATDPSCSHNTYDGSMCIDTITGGTSPYSYHWSTDATTLCITSLAGGTYILTVTDQHHCTAILTESILGTVEVDANAGNDTTICEEKTARLHGSGGENYLWYPATGLSSDIVQSPYATPDATIIYYLRASIGICYDMDTVIITVMPIEPIDAGPDVTILAGNSTTLNAVGGQTGTTYLWNPVSGLSSSTTLNPIVDVTNTTLYYLWATSPNGCVSSDSVIVTVIPRIQFAEGVSPNGDGINDVWTIRYHEYYTGIEVSVYNRWGELMFYNKGCTEYWDGKYKGKELPVGTYYYVIVVEEPTGKRVLTGPITIVR
ncbi:MAG: gliding motility-associated C-terminal domain-containing protein [Bacteroidia bacterium]|nr:gliding motility-associated C-terminal domain-containing protein [Bacteroidia bacterium]